MALRGLIHTVKTVLSLVPQVVTADVNGVGVDTKGYDSVAAVVTSGAIVASGLVLPTLQESDDDAAYTDVAAADLQGTAFVNAAASTQYQVGYAGTKRYVRVRADYVSGTSVAMCGQILLSKAHVEPVN